MRIFSYFFSQLCVHSRIIPPPGKEVKDMQYYIFELKRRIGKRRLKYFPMTHSHIEKQRAIMLSSYTPSLQEKEAWRRMRGDKRTSIWTPLSSIWYPTGHRPRPSLSLLSHNDSYSKSLHTFSLSPHSLLPLLRHLSWPQCLYPAWRPENIITAPCVCIHSAPRSGVKKFSVNSVPLWSNKQKGIKTMRVESEEMKLIEKKSKRRKRKRGEEIREMTRT